MIGDLQRSISARVSIWLKIDWDCIRMIYIKYIFGHQFVCRATFCSLDIFNWSTSDDLQLVWFRNRRFNDREYSLVFIEYYALRQKLLEMNVHFWMLHTNFNDIINHHRIHSMIFILDCIWLHCVSAIWSIGSLFERIERNYLNWLLEEVSWIVYLMEDWLKFR